MPFWQYANMACTTIVYIRRVANDNQTPNRIVELRQSLDMTQAELARRANCSVSALNKIEKGTRGLDQKWMRLLAPHLNVAPADLLPIEDNPFGLSDDERALIARLRNTDPRGRETLRNVVDAILPGADDKEDTAA